MKVQNCVLHARSPPDERESGRLIEPNFAVERLAAKQFLCGGEPQALVGPYKGRVEDAQHETERQHQQEEGNTTHGPRIMRYTLR